MTPLRNFSRQTIATSQPSRKFWVAPSVYGVRTAAVPEYPRNRPPSHVIDAGCRMPLLPIGDTHLIAADDLGYVDLAKPQVEPAFRIISPIVIGARHSSVPWQRHNTKVLYEYRDPPAPIPFKTAV